MRDPLGDGVSSVQLLDHMGNDLTVANDARVSLHKEHTQFHPSDARLIRFLTQHEPMHWTPFSQPQLQFRLKMPIFVAREWFRHTVGLTRNEMSRRYVTEDPETWVPADDEWRLAKEGVKQGSSDEVHPLGHDLSVLYRGHANRGARIYERALELGVAPELARTDHSVATYTEFIETGSLMAYARVCAQRVHPDAQRETRLFAEAVAAEAEELFPVSWVALRRGAERPRKMRELLERIRESGSFVHEVTEVLS